MLAHNASLSGSDKKLAEAMSRAAAAEHAAAESRAVARDVEAALARGGEGIVGGGVAERGGTFGRRMPPRTPRTLRRQKGAQIQVRRVRGGPRQGARGKLGGQAQIAQSLRAAHANQMAQLAEKQSADLAKVKEIARRTLEQCKRREAEATDRAEKLHEELCALKVALKEARDACDAAVGASDGAFRQLHRREDRNHRRRVARCGSGTPR